MRDFHNPGTIANLTKSTSIIKLSGIVKDLTGAISGFQTGSAQTALDVGNLRLQITQEQKASRREQDDAEVDKLQRLARIRALAAAQGADTTGANILSILSQTRGRADVRQARLLDDSETRLATLRANARNVAAFGGAANRALLFGGAEKAFAGVVSLIKSFPRRPTPLQRSGSS